MHELASHQLGMIAFGAIAFGVYFLVICGDWTIDNAVTLAEKSGLSKLFIAATIVALGTSAPELFTSVNANLLGFPGISVGNVIGSNIANILLVVAIAAIIVVDKVEIRVDTAVMIAATAVMAAAVLYGLIPRWGGLVMVVSIVVYVAYQYRASRLDENEVEGNDEPARKVWAMLLAGLAALLVGSESLVQGAVAGGKALAVPEVVIGMTVIAFGTSLPELTACIASARRQEPDMIVGGILGSNIFNILSVMALSAVAKPLIIGPDLTDLDMPFAVAVTLVFAGLLLFSGRIGRTAGIVMVVGYGIFVAGQYLA
ncbi:calcium/sodium antiporter [Salipiger marinus]|uniref:Cation:H+ antiporter n=1 Tax=Salipiger marinus TaxID=555512 RepID=A0A1G8UMH5_9RHOB|nr:calcium/sodium antiporter [Salipiger marinus]SDJ54190.1 cation:H+ antiporter [Salipiger marinus]